MLVMKILILGYSNLAKRKIIPSLKKIKSTKFDVASVSSPPINNGHSSWYRNYNQALNKSSAKIVYISLVNSLHYHFINLAINLGKHVIVDKPISLKNQEVKKLLKKAKKKRLMLSEALTFNYHRQFFELQRIIKKNRPIINIIMKFNIPRPKKNDTKLSNKLGGGCFNDMIPYAAEINRIFLKKNIDITSLIFKSKNNLSESFSINTTNKKTEFYGFFSHNSEYENFIILSSDDYLVRLDRFCAPPDSSKLIVFYKKNNVLKKIKIKEDDMFQNFFIEFFKKLKKKQFNYQHARILFNSNFKENVIKKS